MAVRNGERYLQPLLDSLLRQTRAPLELVVTEDASEDSTPAMLDAFAAAAPFPVRVERLAERGGHVEGFMRAVRRCRGEIVAFCDGDDVWRDEKLEVCGREMEQAGASVVLHSARVVDGELVDLGYDWPPVGPTRTVPPLGLTALDVAAPSMALLFRRDLLDVADFDARPPSRYGHGWRMLNDEWVIFLGGVVGPIRLLADPLVLYRRHGANDSLGPLAPGRRSTLRPAVGDYRRAAEHTAGCADYLEGAVATSPAYADRLAAGADHYRRASRNWALRASLYEAGSRRARARAMRRLVADGGYAPRSTGAFGRAALGKDLAAGVALRLHGSDD